MPRSAGAPVCEHVLYGRSREEAIAVYFGVAVLPRFAPAESVSIPNKVGFVGTGRRSAAEAQALIERALAISDEEDEHYWALVGDLQRLSGPNTFEAMVDLCRANSEAKQRLGLNVLAQLGYESGRPFLEQTLPIVISFCESTGSVPVLRDALAALGHLHDPRGLESVLHLVEHPNEDVRWQVASSLPFVAGDPPDPRSVEALITLTSDEDSDVRDWATFGLGTQLEIDDERIRQALMDRLDDPDGDTAGEALVGLAARHDPRVVERISARLEQPSVGNLIIEAAEKMGDSRFLPFLHALKQRGWDKDDPRGWWLDRAISACEESPER